MKKGVVDPNARTKKKEKKKKKRKRKRINKTWFGAWALIPNDVNPQDEIPFWTHKQIEIYPRKPRIKSKESWPVEILFQEPRFGENATKGLPLISS
jgi:hypothetical protein